MSSLVSSSTDNGIFKLFFRGTINSSNADAVEAEINELLSSFNGSDIVIDAEELKYISSAGLRIILRLRKKYKNLKIINVSSEIYEIFDMTGFTEMMKIEKAYRRLSVDGCEIIGRGANGTVYRIDDDTIIKVYKNAESLPDIHKERELARKAFIMGIPTAIPYDVVKVGDLYGSVFELLNARSFSKLIAEEPENTDKYVALYTELLKKIHSAELKSGELPDMKETSLSWIEFLKGKIDDSIYEKAKKLLTEIPEDKHMLHGDYHTKNVMMQNGETLLIDMDTLCMGHPIFEFASMFLAYVGFDEATPDNTLAFLGYPREKAFEIWRKTLALYFEGKDGDFIEQVEEKALVIGYIRLLRRTLKRGKSDIEEYEHRVERCKKHIAETLPKLDSLFF